MSDRDRTDKTHEIENVERMAARGFVVAGGLFWMTAAFAGPYVFGGTTGRQAIATAMWPLLATVVTLLIGWYYERIAAFLLFAGVAAVVAWGVMFGWEGGVWMIMSFVLIAPMLIAGVLFLLASHSEAVAARTEPEPVSKPVPAARSAA
jgi:hypothetical protein